MLKCVEHHLFALHTEQKFTISKKNRKLATVHAPKSPKTVLGFFVGIFFFVCLGFLMFFVCFLCFFSQALLVQEPTVKEYWHFKRNEVSTVI